MIIPIKGLGVYLTLKVMVGHQFIYLCLQLGKVLREVPFLGYASIAELKFAMFIMQQRWKLAWIIQDDHVVSPEHISRVLHYVPASMDLTEVQTITVTHECGHIPEDLQGWA
jgi:hypothetical protein